MSIKMCVLRTGETVIGDIKEVIDPTENKSLGYKVCAPYVVNYEYSNELEVKEKEVVEKEENNSKISMKFWAPLSAERDFNFPFDFIEVIYEPHQDIIDSYITIIEHYEKEFKHEFTVDTDLTITTSAPEDDILNQLNK